MNTPDRFFQRALDHWTADPNDRVYFGLDRDLDRLPDPSEAAATSRLRVARELLTELDGLQATERSFSETLDLDLARLTLEADVHERTYTFNGRTRAQQLPRASDSIGDPIFMMMINDPRPEGDRLADITARIEQVPAYLDALLARLDTPVARWVSIDVEKVAGLPGLLSTVRGWADQNDWADLPRLDRAIAAATPALSDYAARLGELPVASQLHLDEADARRVVALQGIEQSLEEIREMAREFLAETRATISGLHGRLVEKYRLPSDTSVADLHTFLNEHYAVPVTERLEDILDNYGAERDRILTFIRERDLFEIPDDQQMRILRTPPFMAPSIPAGAMMAPPPLREGVRTSLVYLTLSEELRPEHTRLSIPSMMVHEGIPGHHLQLATAAGHAATIRRIFMCSHHAEGWTTMLEDYMLDQGLMGDLADEARFCAKRDISRIGARVAIDLFFMTGRREFLDVGVDCDRDADDVFDAAGSLLAEVTGFVPGRVQAELNWYLQERGYPLSYLVGNKLTWALKRDLERTQQGRMEQIEIDRLFHRTYLRSGNMPLAFLRRVFENGGWLR